MWLASFLPCVCLLCGALSGRSRCLCPVCEAALPWHGRACRYCAQLLPDDADPLLPCGACLQKPSPLDGVVAAFDYEGPVARLLTGLKFGHELSHAALLGELLGECLHQDSWRPEALLAVPLHRKRLQERGFNQAQELARPLAKGLGLPLLTGVCRRVVATPEQSRLGEAERKRNLRRAFVVDAPPPSRLAIVDDVLTTGSTARALAHALKRAGAGEVRLWVVAKTHFVPRN